MKAAALLLILLSSALLGREATAANVHDAAPADTYFGPLKYSALRVRFLTQQLKRSLENHERLPDDVAHMSVFVDAAFFEWARRYPKDSWLPSSGYGLAKLHEELPGSDARLRAVKLLNFVRSRYARSAYARLSALDLKHGVRVQPEPLWALSTPSPSPSPSPSATPSARPSPRGSPRS